MRLNYTAQDGVTFPVRDLDTFFPEVRRDPQPVAAVAQSVEEKLFPEFVATPCGFQWGEDGKAVGGINQQGAGKIMALSQQGGVGADFGGFGGLVLGDFLHAGQQDLDLIQIAAVKGGHGRGLEV